MQEALPAEFPQINHISLHMFVWNWPSLWPLSIRKPFAVSVNEAPIRKGEPATWWQVGLPPTCWDIVSADGDEGTLKTTIEFLRWAGLQLNPLKCGFLSMINNKKKKYVDPFEPVVGEGQTIPALGWEDSYKYLGITTGRERRGWDNHGQREEGAPGRSG